MDEREITYGRKGTTRPVTLPEMMSDTNAAVQARTGKRRAWITVSHPGLSSEGTIGDIIRLKAVQRALEAEGWSARMITTADERKLRLLSHPENETAGGRRTKNWMKHVTPGSVWSTLKDLAYRRLNHQFYELLESQRDRPDLIVDHNFYFNDAALRFARKHRIPIHLDFEGFIADSMADVPRSLLHRVGRRFELKKYASVDAIWTVSKPLEAKLKEELLDSAPEILVIPNAVSSTGPSPSSIRRNLRMEHKTIIGFVGGLSPWFSLDQLVNSCYQFRRQFPNLHLMLVGDGPERSRLEEQLKHLGGAEWCTMVGRIAHEQVSKYISCFDLAVITNHKWWTSPLKLLEYGAVAVPVIAPNLPSITSIIDEGEAVIFDQNDFADFRRKLRSLIAMGTERQKIGRLLHRKVEANYSMEAMGRRISAALDKKLDRAAEPGMGIAATRPLQRGRAPGN